MILGYDYFQLRQYVFALNLAYYFLQDRFTLPEYASHAFIGFFIAGIITLYPQAPSVAAQWIVYVLAQYLYGAAKLGHGRSAVYAVAATHFGSWLYELPYFHPLSMFYSLRYPLKVNTQILSGVLALTVIKIKSLKITRYMGTALLYFLVVETFFLTKPLHRLLWPCNLMLLARTGVMALTFSLLMGVEK